MLADNQRGTAVPIELATKTTTTQEQNKKIKNGILEFDHGRVPELDMTTSHI